MTISVYDLGPTTDATFKELAISPFVRTVVFILRYKGLPYEIVNVKYTEIAAKAKEIGAGPTLTVPEDKFTVPFIKDSKTGTVVSDSTAIAEYLDKTYPETPAVLPGNSRYIHKLFQSGLGELTGTLYAKRVLFGLTRSWPEEFHGWFQEAPADEVKEAFKVTGEKFAKIAGSLNGGAPYKGFVSGDKPTFSDFTLVAFVFPIKVFYGENSAEWKEVKSWGNGWVGYEIDQILSIVEKK
jgi:glutathione S-transferase